MTCSMTSSNLFLSNCAVYFQGLEDRAGCTDSIPVPAHHTCMILSVGSVCWKAGASLMSFGSCATSLGKGLMFTHCKMRCFA